MNDARPDPESFGNLSCADEIISWIGVDHSWSVGNTYDSGWLRMIVRTPTVALRTILRT